MMENQTRRKFLFDCIRKISALIGTVIFGKVLFIPQLAKGKEIVFSESSCEDTIKGGHNILIAYASEFGTTGEIATTIGDVLCQNGNIVETKHVNHATGINNYDAVIIGGPIHKGTWMAKATKFVKDNKEILQQMPVAYFFSCLVLHKLNPKGFLEAKGYADNLQALVSQIKPVSIGGFAGVLDYSNMGLFNRIMLKTVLANKGIKEGDFRDWTAIRAWAKDIRFETNKLR